MNNITLKDYVQMRWPILNNCTVNVMKENGKPNINDNNKHIWYLYRQAFYGFYHYVNPKKYYSKKAAEFFDKKKKEIEFPFQGLEEINWENQHTIDPNREFLILEHMYTGTMFRLDVLNLYKTNSLTIDRVCEIIIEKYKICWIQKKLFDWDDNGLDAKPENNLIHKTKREGDLKDYYKDCGIDIVNINA